MQLDLQNLLKENAPGPDLPHEAAVWLLVFPLMMNLLLLRKELKPLQ